MQNDKNLGRQTRGASTLTTSKQPILLRTNRIEVTRAERRPDDDGNSFFAVRNLIKVHEVHDSDEDGARTARSYKSVQ